MKYIAQIFGALAICCSIIIYSRKERKKLLIFKCVQDICWCTHYLLLSAFTAAATSALCVTRSIAFYASPKKDKKSIIILFIYLALYALSAALTWKNAFSILPAISSSISTIAFWMKKPSQTKVLSIFASCCTVGYNIAVAHSISVYVGAAITTSIISLIVGAKKEKEENAKLQAEEANEEKLENEQSESNPNIE